MASTFFEGAYASVPLGGWCCCGGGGADFLARMAAAKWDHVHHGARTVAGGVEVDRACFFRAVVRAGGGWLAGLWGRGSVETAGEVGGCAAVDAGVFPTRIGWMVWWTPPRMGNRRRHGVSASWPGGAVGGRRVLSRLWVIRHVGRWPRSPLVAGGGAPPPVSYPARMVGEASLRVRPGLGRWHPGVMVGTGRRRGARTLGLRHRCHRTWAWMVVPNARCCGRLSPCAPGACARRTAQRRPELDSGGRGMHFPAWLVGSNMVARCCP